MNFLGIGMATTAESPEAVTSAGLIAADMTATG